LTKEPADLDTDKTELVDGVVAYAERIAHDANNYIGAILGLSEVLPSVADDPEQVGIIATRIAAAGQLLQIVVNQALLPMMQRFDVPTLHVADAMERLQALSRHLIGRRVEFQAPPLPVDALAAMVPIAMTMGEFSTVIFILLRNAVDAADMSEGARPSIRVALDDLSGDAITVDAAQQNFVSGVLPKRRALALRVYDNGYGFSDVLRRNVASAFRPFVSQSRRASALGLGLSFASAIVERRGGAMAVGCDDNTCITAYLPVHERAGDDAGAAAENVNSSQVIVVDPTAQWGVVTATLLGLLDWPVRQVGSVEEAAAILAESGSGRHVVVIRVPLKSLEVAAVNQLQAVITHRANADLVMMVGPIHSMTRDDAAAHALSMLATLVLPSDTAPADVVNYLIPNI
jgi:signal transduction histidine kinase